MTEMKCDFSLIDAKARLEATRFVFAHHFKYKDVKEEDIYCGITNNLERRKKEHNVDSFIYTCKCDSFFVAKEVERLLKNFGFSTGEQLGNGTEDSMYVYMYKKGPDTRE